MSIDDFIKHVPKEDLDRIISSYNSIPHDGLPDDPKEFVYKSMYRIYTESFMEPEKTSMKRILKKFGMSDFNCFNDVIVANGLLDYLDQETHHCLKNALMFKWDDEKKQFEGLSHESYQVVREKVIHAFVKYTIEFFKGESKDKNRHDRLNLRIDLAPYLQSEQRK